MSSIKQTTTHLSPLSCRIKRHLRYCDPFLIVFPTWDANKSKLILRNKKHQKIVRLSLIAQFLIILLQLYCTQTKSTNFLDTAEGIGLTSIFLGAWLLRAEFYPDPHQIPLLNYICWSNYRTY